MVCPEPSEDPSARQRADGRVGREHHGDEQDSLVSERVAALRENRYDERGKQQPGCFKPVMVGVTDAQPFHQVADQWQEIPLWDTAHDLDQKQAADQAERDRTRLRAPGRYGRMLTRPVCLEDDLPREICRTRSAARDRPREIGRSRRPLA